MRNIDKNHVFVDLCCFSSPERVVVGVRRYHTLSRTGFCSVCNHILQLSSYWQHPCAARHHSIQRWPSAVQVGVVVFGHLQNSTTLDVLQWVGRWKRTCRLLLSSASVLVLPLLLSTLSLLSLNAVVLCCWRWFARFLCMLACGLLHLRCIRVSFSFMSHLVPIVVCIYSLYSALLCISYLVVKFLSKRLSFLRRT